MTTREEFSDLLFEYFDLGYLEGQEFRDHDTVDYKAQETYLKLMSVYDELKNESK